VGKERSNFITCGHSIKGGGRKKEFKGESKVTPHLLKKRGREGTGLPPDEAERKRGPPRRVKPFVQGGGNGENEIEEQVRKEINQGGGDSLT